MRKNLSPLLFGLILLLCATFVHSQNIRAELGGPVSAGIATVGGAGVGGLSPLFALPGVTLNWCNHPANAVPCTNYANTYPSMSSTSPCSTSPTPTQVVLQGSTSCQATDDNFGNMGVWTLPNTVCGGITCYDYTLTVNGVSSGPYVWTTGTSLGNVGGNPTLDNCTPDQSGFTFYSVTQMPALGSGAYFYDASWVFCTSTSTCAGFTGSPYMNCSVHFTAAQTLQTITLLIATSDTTNTHTANFQTCDAFVATGSTLNVAALTCAAAQTFAVPSTAYTPVPLTFNVQSTISGAGVLVVKILTAASGTAPTAVLLVYPTFQ